MAVTEDSLASWRNNIGYIAQETFLFNETIRFNLQQACPDTSQEDIIEVLKLSAAHEFVMKLPEGLDTVIGDRGVRLSGGERQRLALARASSENHHSLLWMKPLVTWIWKMKKKIIRAIDGLHGELTILVIATGFPP